MRIECKDCRKKQKSLVVGEEICVNCYVKKYGKYPKKLMGDTTQKDGKK